MYVRGDDAANISDTIINGAHEKPTEKKEAKRIPSNTQREWVVNNDLLSNLVGITRRRDSAPRPRSVCVRLVGYLYSLC